jgi:hypothetical protein
MIAVFTDFGLHGYTGQMKAVLHRMAPGVHVIDLFADAVGNPKASAYLLAVYATWFPAKTNFLCVIDPGVGGAMPAIILEADSRWYVGPGNGLFELVQRRARETRSWDIEWKPEHLSASFHGRDLFAPVAAMLARGEQPSSRPCEDGADRRPDWPDDLCEIVYVDHFGNARKGSRATAQRKACRGRPRAGAREDLQRRSLLVRDLKWACRNRCQSAARGSRARSLDRYSDRDHPLNEDESGSTVLSVQASASSSHYLKMTKVLYNLGHLIMS